MRTLSMPAGTPQYTATCSSTSRISSRVTPLLSAALTCSFSPKSNLSCPTDLLLFAADLAARPVFYDFHQIGAIRRRTMDLVGNGQHLPHGRADHHRHPERLGFIEAKPHVLE